MAILSATLNESGSMIIVARDDGSMTSVPAEADNPRHVELLAELEAVGKTVAAWTPPPVAWDVVAAECERRIYAVASQNCQMNMTAWIAGGQASDADKSAFMAALTWVHDMRAACAALAAAGDATYAEDARWPACPAGVAALAARF